VANPDDIKALIEVTGKYEVLSTFTEGANGYAFKARHRHLDRVIFLKVIDADPEAQKTFAEPKALMDAVSAGNCENLVSLYDAEHLTQEYILMATEFVDGGNLQAFIQDRSLGQMDTVKITLGVLAGLGHLHAARFLHRDVKPGNLLLNSTPAGRTPKVGDFGSVRRLEGEATRVQASRHSAVYRPPEAWGDDGWFTFASDLYQAGICLYEMVNGPLPYDFKDQLDAQAKREMKDLGITLGDLGAFERSKLVDGCLERRIRKGKLLEMTPSQPYVSGRLAKIIRKATAIDAADRYQNAFEFTNALQALSAPNWRTATDGFTADSWKKWDWKVIPTGSAPKIHWAVSRARSGTGKFRAFGKPFCSAQEAFKSVEDFN
jgi:serine/threonine protein kinase